MLVLLLCIYKKLYSKISIETVFSPFSKYNLQLALAKTYPVSESDILLKPCAIDIYQNIFKKQYLSFS